MDDYFSRSRASWQGGHQAGPFFTPAAPHLKTFLQNLPSNIFKSLVKKGESKNKDRQSPMKYMHFNFRIHIDNWVFKSYDIIFPYLEGNSHTQLVSPFLKPLKKIST